jgi:hypothetical protein
MLGRQFAGVIMAQMTTMVADSGLVYGDGTDISVHFLFVVIARVAAGAPPAPWSGPLPVALAGRRRAEVHLVRGLAGESRMWHLGIVLLNEEFYEAHSGDHSDRKNNVMASTWVFKISHQLLNAHHSRSTKPAKTRSIQFGPAPAL